ncbi:Esterase lipase thioesterase active site [Mycoemilia scoparia]|uniref:Esterase lipase thioesterase active site n=1 Tax=Mycoemilia scoparia TaxID=417184 RepID=A0A9W8DU63_9FUNG|nr:Esterase lipase thioesterase active site [Mycoemilia scoparia]
MTTQGNPTVSKYGSWKSPVKAAEVAAATTSIENPVVDPVVPGKLYWIEGRPHEGGRRTIVGLTITGTTSEDQQTTEYIPIPFNVRNKVHEYGGGAFTVYDGIIVFSNWDDNGIYFLDTNKDSAAPIRIGPKNDNYRYASFAIHPSKKFVLAVREDHTGQTLQEPDNVLVAVALPSDSEQLDKAEKEGTAESVLVDGYDFVSSPAVNPVIHNEVTFYAWSHPNMNWDHTHLFRENLDIQDENELPEKLVPSEIIISNDCYQPTSTYQPRYDSEGNLYCISDPDNYWNPYVLDHENQPVPCLPSAIKADFALPEWFFGYQSYAPLKSKPNTIIGRYELEGKLHLVKIDVANKTVEDLDIPDWTSISWLGTTEIAGEEVLIISAGSPTSGYTFYLYPLNDNANSSNITKLYGIESPQWDPAYISQPKEIEFPTNNGKTAFAFYYPPKNADFVGPQDDLPPLLVLSHGGPSAATTNVFNPKVQYWTSRGYGVVDVNYGGSTGYGREYRERLYPNMGIVDVDDCCNAALYLAKEGYVDRKKLSIMGGSAGGYITLAALTFHPEVFGAGASLYGISDLELLAKETHKFEAKYPVKLIGPYPEKKELYIERSPIYHVDKLACPVVIFQGDEDKVVPPSQAIIMVDALKKKGLTVSYVEFAGEQHGFRKAANIIRCIEHQFWFFGKVFGYEPADPYTPPSE